MTFLGSGIPTKPLFATIPSWVGGRSHKYLADGFQRGSSQNHLLWKLHLSMWYVRTVPIIHNVWNKMNMEAFSAFWVTRIKTFGMFEITSDGWNKRPKQKPATNLNQSNQPMGKKNKSGTKTKSKCDDQTSSTYSRQIELLIEYTTETYTNHFRCLLFSSIFSGLSLIHLRKKTCAVCSSLLRKKRSSPVIISHHPWINIIYQQSSWKKDIHVQ